MGTIGWDHPEDYAPERYAKKSYEAWFECFQAYINEEK